MKTVVVFMFLTIGGIAVPAHANPALAKAKKQFEAADSLLNKTYAKVMADLNKAEAAKLRGLQRDWLGYRDYIAEAAPHFNTGEHFDRPKLTVDYWEMRAGLTEDRVEFLRIYTGKNAPKGITGNYMDAFYGSLELEETKDGLLFSIVVSRGSLHHIGEIAGIAERKGEIAHYLEKVPADEDRPPCELTFTFSKGHIVKIDGKNTAPYSGTRAYFDGTYYKSGPLKEPIKLK